MAVPQLAKRLFDLSILALSFPVWACILSVLGVLVRVRLGSPILFKQKRSGLNGRSFEIIKFRTMTDETGPDGGLLPDNLRLTSFGRWLRSTSLDELPEVLNVVRGEMSFVGPRPLVSRYLERYSEVERRRLEVLPGITGWAQVNGRNSLDWNEKFRLDVWYVDNRSMFLDVKILMLTVGKVAKSEGVNATKDIPMDEFMGHQEDKDGI